jgi:alpha-1,3-glucan synthase
MRSTALIAAALAGLVAAAPYADEYADYNLNTNKNAQTPLDYSTTRPSGKWTPSPQNWRQIPFYTILPDKWANGDPSNDDYFGTMFESDWRETQLRVGGDVAGMAARLDYLQGMGIRGVFMSGTLFLNMLWQADSLLIPHSPAPPPN